MMLLLQTADNLNRLQSTHKNNFVHHITCHCERCSSCHMQVLTEILANGIIWQIKRATISEEPLQSLLKHLLLSPCHSITRLSPTHEARGDVSLATVKFNLSSPAVSAEPRRRCHHTPPPPPPRQLEASAARKITHDGESRSSTARRRDTSNSFTYLQLQTNSENVSELRDEGTQSILHWSHHRITSGIMNVF